MKLNKRYIRSISENRSFYISSTVLTVVTLLMYFLFNMAGNAIINFGEEFFSRNKLEDAHFSTYLPIEEEKIKNLEKDYNLTLEAQHYINIETDGVTARIFQCTKNIDLYEVTEGDDISNDDEIVISEGYAQENNIKLGDKIKISDTEYTISGFMQRPDYLYMLENESDSYKNITTFFLCYMSDNAFERLDAGGVQYLVRFGEDSDETGFRKEVHRDYFMRSYTDANDNERITMVDRQAEMFIIMAYVILCTTPLIAVALIAIIISRKVKSEQKLIGTLSALGYKKGRLMWHYAGFAAIPGVVGGVLTAVISAIFAQPMSELCLADYEPMRIVAHIKVTDVVLGIVIPTAMYIIAALISVSKLLKKNTVLLLSGKADDDKKMKRIFAGRKMSFRTKYAVRSLLGNPMRSIVVLLGVFLGSFIMLVGQGLFDSINHMGDVAAKDMGEFEYQYILGELSEENIYGGETMLVCSAESTDGGAMSVIGTSEDNSLLNLKDENGDKVSVENGYYITSLIEYTLGWHKGDTITLKNPLSLEEHKITINGIIKNSVQKVIYTSKINASKVSGISEGSFNCIASKEKLDIPKALVAQEIRRSDISRQVDTMMSQMDFMLQIMIWIGIIICIAAVYVAANMMVTEGKSNISMLKVLGYRDRQINRIVLDVNHILLPIGMILSIPFVYATCGAFFKLLMDYNVMLIDTYIAPKSYVISFGLTVMCYFGSLWLLRRKVKRIDMAMSLKDNRE